MRVHVEDGPRFYHTNLAVWIDRVDSRGVDREALARGTLQKFAHKSPHRIYYNPDATSVFGVVSLFSEPDETLPQYAAYMEVNFPFDGSQQNVYAISGSRTQHIRERQVDRWARRYGMTGDILGNPSAVYQIAGTDDEFLHVGETQGGPLMWYYRLFYSEGYQGVRIPITLGRVGEPDLIMANVDLLRIAQPPQPLLDYAYGEH